MLMEKAKDRRFWEKVRTESIYQEVVSQIRAYYEQMRYDEIPALSYRARMRFYADGDRHEFEKPYFRRRTYLSSAALMALIYPDRPEYLEELQELIWAICEEYSWVLPAHCGNGLEDGQKCIDLFSAETAFALAEISYLLEDRLDRLVKDRIRAEVKQRILHNYENGSFWWETSTNNWSAVCAGNVGGALMYLFPENFEKLIPRLTATMQCLLDGFPEDGTCLEGISYWHYGFGNYIWFSDLLKQFTDGRIDLMKKEKVEQIAGYAQRTLLCGGATVSFADGAMAAKVNVLMQSFLVKLFPETVRPLPADRTEFQKMNVMWMTYFRSVYYLELTEGAREDVHSLKAPSEENIFLPDAGQVIVHRDAYSLAVKAGDNDEPHNHNDVGNFIMATKNGQIFCDLGAGRYTRQYFAPESRYKIFCNGSQGHSVPIIGGKLQKEGKEHRGELLFEENRIMVEMANAYEDGVIDRLTRTFTCLEKGFLLKDSFSGGENGIVERFVTLKEPEVHLAHVKVNGVRLGFRPGQVRVKVNRAQHENHDLSISVVNCIDFELNPGVSEAEFAFEVME